MKVNLRSGNGSFGPTVRIGGSESLLSASEADRNGESSNPQPPKGEGDGVSSELRERSLEIPC